MTGSWSTSPRALGLRRKYLRGMRRKLPSPSNGTVGCPGPSIFNPGDSPNACACTTTGFRSAQCGDACSARGAGWAEVAAVAGFCAMSSRGVTSRPRANRIRKKRQTADGRLQPLCATRRDFPVRFTAIKRSDRLKDSGRLTRKFWLTSRMIRAIAAPDSVGLADWHRLHPWPARCRLYRRCWWRPSSKCRS